MRNIKKITSHQPQIRALQTHVHLEMQSLNASLLYQSQGSWLGAEEELMLSVPTAESCFCDCGFATALKPPGLVTKQK